MTLIKIPLKKLIIIEILFVFVVLLSLSAYVYYKLRIISKPAPQPEVQKIEQLDNPDNKSGSNIFTIGSKGIIKGKFLKFENGRIFIEIGEEVKDYPPYKNRLSLGCSSQKFEDASNLDMGQITSGHIIAPEKIGEEVNVNETVVLLLGGSDDYMNVITMIINVSSCK